MVSTINSSASKGRGRILRWPQPLTGSGSHRRLHPLKRYKRASHLRRVSLECVGYRHRVLTTKTAVLIDRHVQSLRTFVLAVFGSLRNLAGLFGARSTVIILIGACIVRALTLAQPQRGINRLRSRGIRSIRGTRRVPSCRRSGGNGSQGVVRFWQPLSLRLAIE